VYPRLPIDAEISICEKAETNEDRQKLRQLYSGPLEIYWDSGAELARNKATLPWACVSERPANNTGMTAEISVHLPQGSYSCQIDDLDANWGQGGGETLE
jgi:hypothetical protein